MKLKNINFGLGLVALLALSSCADDKFSEYRTDMTKNLKEYQYLNNYEPLKKYVEDMKASGKCNPDFKLGIALEAAEFNKQGLVYCLAGSNFNEMTAGNAMKYASCVKNDGTFDFNTVKDFVANAKDAGLTIYGHTLAWHSQQNKTYLSKLIADKEIPVDPSQKVETTDYERDCSTLSSYAWEELPASVKTEWNKDGAVVITNPEPIDPWYSLQYWLVDGISLNPGTTYKITILCKAEGKSPAHVRFKLGNWGDNFELENGFEIPVGGGYKEVSFEVTPKIDSNGLLFQHGDFVGKIYWKSIKITHSEAPSVEIFTDCLRNGEMKTGGDMSNFVVREVGKGDVAGTPIAGGPDGKNCVVVHANANAANEWDTQFFIYTPNKTWSAGDKYKITFYYKASENIDAVTQCHSKPGYYLHNECLSSNPSFTTKWQKYESTGKIPEQGDGMKAIAFNLNVGKKDHAIDYYFADIHWYTVEKGNKIPLKPEEKKSLLTDAMGKWIDGMMEATDGYVTSWDVVNEAISGTKGAHGINELQHATNALPSDVANSFYWQDYLGDIDYVRTAVRDARKSFAKHNGDPSKLKLFINDYNLEGYWDQHAKLNSLINWIGLWEDPNAEEPVVIDGIGTQMHVTCYGNATDQAKLQSDIEEMFKLMAKTGKLVKISELDMNYVDEAGTSVTFDKMTEEQHKQMRSFYTFIIQKYFELIPPAQQYGITQWCATDSPKDSGWRAGCPTGLWDSNYLRKHTYAGFAVGLGAPEYWNDAK